MEPDPFSPVRLGPFSLNNRFILAAAASGGSADENGIIVPDEITRLSRYADEEVGLIITGAIGISDTAISQPTSSRLVTEEQVAGFSRLCGLVHEKGGKIAAQLCHSGIWTGRHAAMQHRQSVGPSRIEGSLYTNRKGFFDNYRAASPDDIREIIESFARSAALAEKAGFDAVEVHAAHDSLLSQFLSPITNLRSDAWGGSLDGRLRLHRDVGREIRSSVSPEFPVIIKLGVSDGICGGLPFHEGREAARMCASAGYDIIEVSQGLQGMKFSEMALRSPIATRDEEGFTREWCREIKRDGAVTIMTGGLRSYDLIEEIIANREIDAVGLCRPLICEPGLIRRWKGGDWNRSACTSCNRCAIAISQGNPLACYRDSDQ